MIIAIDNAEEKREGVTYAKRCFSVEEVSEQTTLSKATVRNLIKAGTIKAKRLGGRRVVILAEELDRFLAA